MPENCEAMKEALFFGLPYSPGRTDSRYPEYIDALKLQTDDCIGFSILIAQSLISYGERLTTRYGKGAPIISQGSYDKAADLVPDMSGYIDFLKK